MNEPLFQLRLTGVLIQNGALLLVKQHVNDRRAWSLPGGRLEPGETMEQGLVRELREETGLVVAAERLLYLCDPPPCGNTVHITFLLRYCSGKLALPDNSHDENPISDVRFVPLEELPSYGFSERFQALCRAGFPNAGNYRGAKGNIGL